MNLKLHVCILLLLSIISIIKADECVVNDIRLGFFNEEARYTDFHREDKSNYE